MTTTDPATPFSLQSFFTPTLPEGGNRLTVITSIEAGAQLVLAAGAPGLVLVFIIDKSGSMQGMSIDAVKAAVLNGLEALDEQAIFAVVAFDEFASIVAAPQQATPEAKVKAAHALDLLNANGGTAFSTGLDLARGLFERYPDAIRRGIFLTDGNNETERPDAFSPVLRRCIGLFECDCWGLGTRWTVGEVQEIARALNGKASLVPSPHEVVAAFRSAVDKAASKAIGNVRLRLWTMPGAHITLVKQMNVAMGDQTIGGIEDLTTRGAHISEQVTEFAIGSWAPGESRDYQIDLSLPPGAIGDEVRAMRPSIVFAQAGHDQEVRATRAGCADITWTADEALSSRINPRVAHYTGQEELARVIQDGVDARARGDEDAATQLLGRAVQIAAESGNEEMTTRLKKVVDIDDAATGTVRLRRTVDQAAAMDLELESTTTKRAARRPAPVQGT